MLTPEERFFIWDKYKKKIDTLYDEVSSDVFRKFVQNDEYDKDHETVLILFLLFKRMSEFINLHHKDLHEELRGLNQEQLNAQCAFDAWSLNLCPNVVGHKCNWILRRIATFKIQRKISKEDSEHALTLFYSSGL